MSGAHRSTAQRPAASALKSAAWLLTGAALIAALLALLGMLAFVSYLSIAHPADLRPLTIAVQSAIWVEISGHLMWVLFRKRPRTAAQHARVIGEGCLLLCVTIGLLMVVGDQLGWTHGPSRYAVTGVAAVLLLATAAYWLIGERRLRAALERRAVARQTSS